MALNGLQCADVPLRNYSLTLTHSPGGANVHLHLIHASLYSLESSTQTASRLVQPFLHSSRQRVIVLYSGPPLPPPLKIATSHGGSGPPSNTCFLGSTRVHVPNAISTGSAVFAGLTTVTHQQTDHAATSVL